MRDMSKKVKLLASITVVLSFCLLCVGFATYQDTLEINGSLNLAVSDTMKSGSQMASAFDFASTNHDVKVDTIVLDSYYNQSDVIEAAGMDWDSDVPDVSVKENESIKLFTVGDTMYVLAEGGSSVKFNADSTGIFAGLTDIVTINLYSVDFSNCTDLTSAFEGCTALNYVNYKAIPDLSTVTSVDSMFKNCPTVETMQIAGLDLSSCITAKEMFYGCSSLIGVDMSKVTFSSALQDVSGMFEGCSDMSWVNVTGMNTSGVVSAEAMFRGCTGLTEITGITSLSMPYAQTFTDMFAYCTSLTSLDLSNLNSSNAVNTAGMFGGCESLEVIDLYGFDSSKVTNMKYMFSNRGSREGDESVESMSLTTVYVSLGWNTSRVILGQDVFLGTENIVGGEGFAFNGTTGSVYAVYDKLSVRGYLTLSEKDWGKAYMLYYHTFDENGKDTIYTSKQIYLNRETEIEAAPAQNSSLSFLGWSPHGTWISDAESTFYPTVESQIPNLDNPNYTPEQRILYNASKKAYYLGSDLLVKFGTYNFSTKTGEIHLYDLYSEYYVKIIGTDLAYSYPSMRIDFMTSSDASSSSSGITFIRYYFNKDVLPAATSSSENYGFYTYFTPKYNLLNKTKTHYVHPGIYFRLAGGIVDSDTDYTTSLNVNGVSASGNYLVGRSTYTVTLTITKPSSCIASGSMVMLADGRQVAVENLKGDELVLCFNHETGKYEARPIMFFEDDGVKEYTIINLKMSDGTHLKFIDEHGLFDLTLNKYVYIDESNYKDFIGHEFAKVAGDGYERFTMTEAYLTKEITGCYSFPSVYNMNFIVDGYLSMPGGITGLFNFFEYDEDLKYDSEKMAEDIATYGLFTYEDFKEYMSEDVFEQIFPVKYLTVSIGKGLTTPEGIEQIIERYLYQHGIASPEE